MIKDIENWLVRFWIGFLPHILLEYSLPYIGFLDFNLLGRCSVISLRSGRSGMLFIFTSKFLVLFNLCRSTRTMFDWIRSHPVCVDLTAPDIKAWCGQVEYLYFDSEHFSPKEKVRFLFLGTQYSPTL